MKIIIGLGNPGSKYERTRHNVGFDVVDEIARQIAASPPREKFNGEIAEGNVDGEKVVLLCPHTFMNASGQSVRKAFDFYKLSDADCLVICDDMNLPLGRIRIRPSGSAGGQKGLADIIRHLGSESIARLRVGIDRPPEGWTVTHHVLGRFTDSESETVQPVIQKAAQAAVFWTKRGASEAMNRYNATPSDPDRSPPKRRGRESEQSNP